MLSFSFQCYQYANYYQATLNFVSVSSKPSVDFTLTMHFILDRAHHRHSLATCAKQLPHGPVQLYTVNGMNSCTEPYILICLFSLVHSLYFEKI